MPGQPRPNAKAAKIVYKILGTPKDLQQFTDKKPSERRVEEWFIDSSASQ